MRKRSHVIRKQHVREETRRTQCEASKRARTFLQQQISTAVRASQDTYHFDTFRRVNTRVVECRCYARKHFNTITDDNDKTSSKAYNKVWSFRTG